MSNGGSPADYLGLKSEAVVGKRAIRNFMSAIHHCFTLFTDQFMLEESFGELG